MLKKLTNIPPSYQQQQLERMETSRLETDSQAPLTPRSQASQMTAIIKARGPWDLQLDITRGPGKRSLTYYIETANFGSQYIKTLVETSVTSSLTNIPAPTTAATEPNTPKSPTRSAIPTNQDEADSASQDEADSASSVETPTRHKAEVDMSFMDKLDARSADIFFYGGHITSENLHEIAYLNDFFVLEGTHSKKDAIVAFINKLVLSDIQALHESYQHMVVPAWLANHVEARKDGLELAHDALIQDAATMRALAEKVPVNEENNAYLKLFREKISDAASRGHEDCCIEFLLNLQKEDEKIKKGDNKHMEKEQIERAYKALENLGYKISDQARYTTGHQRDIEITWGKDKVQSLLLKVW